MTEPSPHISAEQVTVETPAVVTVLSAGDPVATEKEATRNTDDLSHTIKILTRVVLLFCALTFITGGANYMQVKSQNEKLISIAETNRENGERVKDCTDPGGACFNATEKRSAETIRVLQEYSVLANACTVILYPASAPAVSRAEAEDQIRKCVELRLKAKPGS